MAERVDVLSGPQARRSSVRQTLRLELGIVTASKRVHDGCVDWLDVAVLYVPSPWEGRDTSCINALPLRSFFFLLVVIPANRHSAPTLCRPEREHLTFCLRIEANREARVLHS
jgi:hypothetical protein